ncbi:peptidase U32 family protein [Chlorobium sp. N1]|uniref:peptidase U32 family protein n=1 Tax=Chlorobium sp. N1 TaxID=2491138 RepID=UPI00103D70FA|nr:peptidase U32 family protein [Chlorobium sp. N1]TCD47871.1 U32 family peptidase [Chlorobium sp. N1]
MQMKRPELIAPAGSRASMQAALRAGADAVYFGADGCNMRAASESFTASDFPAVRALSDRYGARAYLALNTTVYDSELAMVYDYVRSARAAGLDAVICWDAAVIEACRRESMPFHLSTQASVSNSAALRHFAALGATMVVPARELTIEQVEALVRTAEAERLPVTIECFVHGAMCVAVSGRCFLSQELFGRSANRGECVQPCRRSYVITDPEEDKSFELGTGYVLSPKDLCAVEFLDRLTDAGIGAFKIEGRNRSPEYVQTVTRAYRTAIDCCMEERGKPGFRARYGELTGRLKGELEKVYNRGFSSGFYFGRPMEAWADSYGSQALEQKTYLGKVVKYYPKAGVAEILIHAGRLEKGAKLSVQGPLTGVETFIAEGFRTNDMEGSPAASKGDTVTLKCPLLRRNDAVYLLEERP